MANGVNKVILIGNLGRDPDINTLESGVKKATFSLATTEVFNNKDGQKTQQTEWHNIVLWRKLAEVAESYLKKGSQVYIEGRIRTRSWDDKEGNKHYTTEIVGDSMTMLGRPGTQGKADDPSAASTDDMPPLETAAEDDGLPF